MALILTTRKRVYLGIPTFALFLSDDGGQEKEFKLFTLFVNDLIEANVPFNTVRNYALWVKTFLWYMLVGIGFEGASQVSVNMLYRSYYSYLVFGVDAYSDVVRKICGTLPSPCVGVGSAITYHASINRLINFSKEYIKLINDYKSSGLAVEDELQHDFVHKISEVIVVGRSRKEQQARNEYSFGTVSKFSSVGRKSYTRHLPVIDKYNDLIDDHKFFPLEKISELIASASSHRDAALWALMGGTSLRVSESMQVLREDIDLVARKVYVMKPVSRESIQTSYAGLNELQFKMLAWKGRATKHTVFLEPYGEMFFNELQLYYEREYNPSVSHNFVFQTKYGDPLYLSDYSSVVYTPFRETSTPILESIGWREKWLSPHSLRHSYIYFMKNYLEHSRGIGLSDSELMLLTGHTDPASLKRYAKCDYELLLIKIAGANTARHTGGVKSQTEYRIEYLERQLEDFKSLLKAEQGLK